MTSYVLIRRTSLAVAGVAVALVLAACGSGGGTSSNHAAGHGGASPTATATATGAPGTSASAKASPSAAAPSAGAHNAADTEFAQQMIPHHRQAVTMAELAGTRASSAQVKQLAQKIKGAQDPEIATMTGWLTAWGEQVPAAGADEHAAHGGGSGAPMAGMMTPAQMDELTKASGAAFDKAFLTMMIAHHEGAVQMADAEKAKGAYGPAKELAGVIATAQTAEITLMKQLLAG
ncbi:DUF305 domain-containing protein [Kitasatospora sp. NPDC004240]